MHSYTSVKLPHVTVNSKEILRLIYIPIDWSVSDGSDRSGKGTSFPKLDTK